MYILIQRSEKQRIHCFLFSVCKKQLENQCFKVAVRKMPSPEMLLTPRGTPGPGPLVWEGGGKFCDKFWFSMLREFGLRVNKQQFLAPWLKVEGKLDIFITLSKHRTGLSLPTGSPTPPVTTALSIKLFSGRIQQATSTLSIHLKESLSLDQQLCFAFCFISGENVTFKWALWKILKQLEKQQLLVKNWCESKTVQWWILALPPDYVFVISRQDIRVRKSAGEMSCVLFWNPSDPVRCKNISCCARKHGIIILLIKICFIRVPEEQICCCTAERTPPALIPVKHLSNPWGLSQKPHHGFNPQRNSFRKSPRWQNLSFI